MRESFGRNIKIPNDLSIIGFDDIRLAQFITPRLTTVQLSQVELAKIAFLALMNQLNNDPAQPQSEYELDTHLVLRHSTKMVPAANKRMKGRRSSAP